MAKRFAAILSCCFPSDLAFANRDWDYWYEFTLISPDRR
jgi:hypothetical protein